ETIAATTEEVIETEEETEEAKKADTIPAIDFTLQDQYGNTHTLSEYKGKTVFLNFWATWCPPCRNEMPDIQKLYEEYQAEEDPSVIILGIAAPNYGREGSEEEIIAFLEKNGYTYPVVMDTTGEMFMQYGIYSFPTTFMIDAEGNIFGYLPGQLNEMVMRSIIEQTVTGVRYSTDTQS
ncbi:MAG: TlpA family protein disulfide reductase, partial [Lachnospiraceae bacterium]|nr:TlpA family protein disulfide reductase [Lachnospiraceae bacterium]